MGSIHPLIPMVFFSPNLIYLPLGVDGYCCTRSYLMTHTCALGRTPLDRGWVHCTGLYLYSTHHSQETNVHAPSRIWTWNPSMLVATDLSLDQAGQNY